MPERAGGEIGRLIAERDWSTSPLGQPSGWPQELRDAVRLILPAEVQIVMFWGEDYIALYNEAYGPTIGDKHPAAFGRPARESWTELWGDLEPLLRRVRETGDTFAAKDRSFYIERHGYGEEVFFDISYSPVRDEAGDVMGVLCIVDETTAKVAYRRRLQFELELGDRLRGLNGAEAVMACAAEFLGQQLGADRAGYAEVDEEAYFTVTNDWSTGVLPPLVGRHPIVAFGKEVLATLRAGRTLTIDDAHADPRTRPVREAFVAIGLKAAIAAPLLRDGRLVAILYVHSARPRRWTETEIALAEAAAERTWAAVEQAKAEALLSASSERLRAATEAANLGTWDLDVKTGVLRWDDRCKAMFGLPPEAEVTLEKTFYDGLHRDDRERVAKVIARALDPDLREITDTEYRAIAPDGAERWIAVKGRATFEDGQATRFVGTVIDVSGRKRAEEALAASDAALREESRALEVLNATAAQVAAELDLDRLVQTVVDAGMELTGAQFGAFFYNVVDDGGERYTLYKLSGADRSQFAHFPMPRNTKVFGPTFAGEGPVRADDITKDPRFGQNPPFYGHPKGHLPVRSYLAAPVISRTGEVIGGLFYGHERIGVFSERSESLLTGLAAQAATGIDNARLFQDAQRLNQTLERQVAARTAERDRIWRVSGDLLGVADMDGIWLSVNPAWTRVLGWTEDEIVGRTSAWIGHPDDCALNQEQLGRLSKGTKTLAFENRLRTRGGDYRTLSWTTVVAQGALYCTGRDVTAERERQIELDEMQERLRQSQKMETVGQLTGGVAHDFNNLLQIIAGNLDLLLRTLPEDAARQRRAAESAMGGAKRAATLTQRLLAFSRRQPLSPKPLSANRLISGMSELLHRSLGETIEVEVVLSPSLWRAEIDPNALENAILNLALNARDAMPDGGKLTIETANTHLDRDYVAQHPELSTGQYVSISVSDNGHGMTPEVVERVFEPFFTTKEVGKGTGLGLSMVYGFVKQSGGHVKLYSEPGQGTTVRLYLPRLMGPVAEEGEPPPPAAERAREETILVCEDDPEVRAFSAEVLRDLGYVVREAVDGPSALRLLERDDGRVDLLFTDVVLPGGMTGSVLAEQARRTRPGVKVLFTTGYARNAIVHHGRLDPGVELITKPFSYTDLAGRIRDLLDAPGSQVAGQ
jgi:PAS domain S-box-containing protein